MKRKIYQKMLEWKAQSNGRTALMLDGARRVGKSYVAEAFARNEYAHHLLIDFSTASARNGLVGCAARSLPRNRLTHYRGILSPAASARISASVRTELSRARKAAAPGRPAK